MLDLHFVVIQRLIRQDPEQNPSNLKDSSAVTRRLAEQSSGGLLQPEVFYDSLRKGREMVTAATLYWKFHLETSDSLLSWFNLAGS